MEKVILFGVKGGSFALDSSNFEPIAFIPSNGSDEFKRLLDCAGVETLKYPLRAGDEERLEREAQIHMEEFIKAFKGET